MIHLDMKVLGAIDDGRWYLHGDRTDQDRYGRRQQVGYTYCHIALNGLSRFGLAELPAK